MGLKNRIKNLLKRMTMYKCEICGEYFIRGYTKTPSFSGIGICKNCGEKYKDAIREAIKKVDLKAGYEEVQMTE